MKAMSPMLLDRGVEDEEVELVRGAGETSRLGSSAMVVSVPSALARKIPVRIELVGGQSLCPERDLPSSVDRGASENHETLFRAVSHLAEGISPSFHSLGTGKQRHYG
jgi:hypothetical protein